jgi:hypothetical protein
MAVSMLKDTFSPREKTRLVGLANWGRRRHHNGLPVNPLIIFTGTELFARWHVQDAWKEKGGKAKALSSSRDDRIARQLPGGCHDPEACRTANAASQLRPSKKRLGFNTETSMSSRQRALTLI